MTFDVFNLIIQHDLMYSVINNMATAGANSVKISIQQFVKF